MSYDINLEVASGAGATVEVYSTSMTSNLAPMWRAAGCDIAEFHGKTAVEFALSLHAAIKRMTDPYEVEDFRKLEPGNGWGNYDGCVKFLRDLLDASLTHHYAIVRVSR